MQVRNSATSEAGFDPFQNGFVHWAEERCRPAMKFIARGLFSTQCALGHVADVKDAVGFADIIDFVQVSPGLRSAAARA